MSSFNPRGAEIPHVLKWKQFTPSTRFLRKLGNIHFKSEKSNRRQNVYLLRISKDN